MVSFFQIFLQKLCMHCFPICATFSAQLINLIIQVIIVKTYKLWSSSFRFSPGSYHFIPHMSKYSPQHLQCARTTFMPIHNLSNSKLTRRKRVGILKCTFRQSCEYWVTNSLTVLSPTVKVLKLETFIDIYTNFKNFLYSMVYSEFC